MPTQPKRLPIRPTFKRPPRKTTTERGYGYAHQVARKRLLAAEPICQRCEDAISTDMHHIDHDPHNRHPSNLEALCERCHHAEAHGGGR